MKFLSTLNSSYRQIILAFLLFATGCAQSKPVGSTLNGNWSVVLRIPYRQLVAASSLSSSEPKFNADYSEEFRNKVSFGFSPRCIMNDATPFETNYTSSGHRLGDVNGQLQIQGKFSENFLCEQLVSIENAEKSYPLVLVAQNPLSNKKFVDISQWGRDVPRAEIEFLSSNAVAAYTTFGISETDCVLVKSVDTYKGQRVTIFVSLTTYADNLLGEFDPNHNAYLACSLVPWLLASGVNESQILTVLSDSMRDNPSVPSTAFMDRTVRAIQSVNEAIRVKTHR